MSQDLIPADYKRCQAEKPNSVNFMTLGGVQRLIRCENIPEFIATEKNAGADGKKGTMSLCSSCLKVANEQLGEQHFDVEMILAGENAISNLMLFDIYETPNGNNFLKVSDNESLPLGRFDEGEFTTFDIRLSDATIFVKNQPDLKVKLVGNIVNDIIDKPIDTSN